MEETIKSSESDDFLGSAICIVFIAAGFVLFFKSDWFIYETTSKIVGLILLFFGFGFFGTELSSKVKDETYTYLGIGLGFSIPSLLITTTDFVFKYLLTLPIFSIGMIFLLISFLSTIKRSVKHLGKKEKLLLRVGYICGAIVSIWNLILLIIN